MKLLMWLKHLSVFSHFGFAREILSDCGSEFMSQLTKVFLDEFGIKHIRTSPYHPATNGSCERFNGTLKSMLRAVAEDFPDSWDQTLPWILFAYREVPVETLGFSPFELLYGRSVPGPLSLLKDSWLETPIASNLKSVVEFILGMRERLRSSITHAQQHAKEQKHKSKVWYDKKARSRSFEPGQEILALLPLPGNPLQDKYCGPYTILEKLGPVDYLIDTPNCRKQKSVCHVNLLKLHRRSDEKLFPNSANAVTVNVATVVPENDVGVSIPALSDLKISTPTHTKNEYLTQLQQTELDELLAMQIFFQTHLVKHLWPHTILHLFQIQNLFRCLHIGCSPKKQN